MEVGGEKRKVYLVNCHCNSVEFRAFVRKRILLLGLLLVSTLISACFHIPQSDTYSIYGKIIDYDCNPVGPGTLQYVTYREGVARVSGGPASFGSYIPDYPILKSTTVNAEGEFSIVDKSSRPIWIFSQEIQSRTIEGKTVGEKYSGWENTSDNPVLVYSTLAGTLFFYSWEVGGGTDEEFVSTVENESGRRGLIYSPGTLVQRYSSDYTGSSPEGGGSFILRFSIKEVRIAKKKQFMVTVSVHNGQRGDRGVLRIALEDRQFSKPESALRYRSSISLFLDEKDIDKKITQMHFRVKSFDEDKADRTATKDAIESKNIDNLTYQVAWIEANVSTSMIILAPESLSKLGDSYRFRAPTKHPALYGRAVVNGLAEFDKTLFRMNQVSEVKIPSGHHCGEESTAPDAKLNLDDVLLKIRGTKKQ